MSKSLIVLGLAIVAAVVVSPTNMPITSLMVPLLLGSLLLTPRHLPYFVVFVFGAEGQAQHLRVFQPRGHLGEVVRAHRA